MNNLSAFIMVATNRPFDCKCTFLKQCCPPDVQRIVLLYLNKSIAEETDVFFIVEPPFMPRSMLNRVHTVDEAVLRRLPRRLLLDLPAEKDREEILKIHLKTEILDESVSLPQLAKNTPFYSGSDLKNICVAAAMACIREENEVAAKHTGEEPYVYPEKRILTKAHFDKAMEEISASISEDMSTLTAIRKFDEKYGDRKGRRKKAAAMGFGGTTIVEKDSEAARVRKLEA
jgi:hypothetical protein